jgi:hypothetical protein
MSPRRRLHDGRPRAGAWPARSRRARPGVGFVLGFLVILGGTLGPADVRAQTTLDPAQTAERFFRSVQLLNWPALADMTHPRTLALFRSQTDAMVGRDERGTIERRMFGSADGATRASWGDERLFAVVVEALYREVPALLEVMATNEYEIVGFVPDGDEHAQVVVRTKPYANGPAPSQLSVLTLARDVNTWRVEDGALIDALLVGLGTFGR